MGSGGTYFISCQQIIESTHIKWARLGLRLGVEFDEAPGHNCINCNRIMTDDELSVFSELSDVTNLSSAEDTLDNACKQKLVYMGGYIVRKFPVPENSEQTYDYYNEYGSYLNEMCRGRLTIPEDIIVQWIILCYLLFSRLSKIDLCRTSLSSYFMKLSDIHEIGILECQARSLSNIFFNNLCKAENPRSSKEVGQKVLKLNDKV